ncbi:hypothetical protein SAMN04489806_0343 [Paramicrobacterium humi]|uniref:Secreted protein n=1 Tax=Paramicrobacterium humi TaxID=640635 RepID=A0A1H4IWQ1_9MICO|nr:hypothetical protein [Microbacterium humi]SEB38504.1 hypothetical protein SAMN04489806_0343 [Microbacterium humi]
MARTRGTITIAASAVLAAALTGCAGGQSKAEACAVFSDADQALVTAISTSSGSLLEDPATAKTDLDSAVGDFESSVSKISHDEVRAKADGMTSALKTFNAQFAAAADATVEGSDDVDSEQLSDSLTAAENAESKVVQVCNS